ncbi:MAG TPA: MotA/TolQ/ExbB proton channel family protein, partial [Taishania sp.]|nr:MotA/TolQ/ExbB proton channel family protein [Taishania sp.]
MSGKKSAGGFSALMGAIAIVIAVIAGILIYKFIFGNPANFVDNNPENEPLQGNFLGIIYKGGFIVPMLVAINLIVVIFTIERFVTLGKAKGKNSLNVFVEKVKAALAGGNIAEARELCEAQKGSLANVVVAGLDKYELMANVTSMNK